MCNVTFELKVMEKYKAKLANARQRGIEFKLSYQSMKNLMLAKKCAYTGVSLTEARPGVPLRATDRTIDRVDASKGYVIGNVVACCHAVNHMKSLVENDLAGTGLTGLRVVRKVFDKTIKRIEKQSN